MISWIQRTFQHHFRLIFAILLIGMVIPFIFTIGSTPGIGRADRTVTSREYFGHNLISREESSRLTEDARISAELQYGQDVSPEQLQYYMLQRVAGDHLARELHLPAPSQTEITDFIKKLRMFAGKNGEFDVTRYDAFRESLRQDSGVTEGDILRVISEDVQMKNVQRLLGGPGFVTPGDVNEVFVKGDTSWTISTASVDYATFDTDLKLTDAQVAKFFTDNSFRYTVPPRVSAEYVSFPASDFLAAQSVTDAEVREYYDAHPAEFPKAPDKAGVKSDPEAHFALVKPLVRAALLNQKAKQAAVKAASDLAYSIYEDKVSHASLDAFLASRKLTPEPLKPFTSEAGPAELGGSRQIAAAAFELNADRFYSEGLPSPDGGVVLFWEASLPSYVPPPGDILDKVRADAVDSQRRAAFVEFGKRLKAGIERRLKEGEPFDKAAAEAAAPDKVTIKTYPTFTLREQPHDVDQAVYSVLDTLDKGSVSDMEATPDKGVVVYAADKKVPVVSETNPRFQYVRSQLAATYAGVDATQAMRELMETELKRTDILSK